MRAPVPLAQRNFVFRGFERGFSALERGYTRLLGLVLRARYVVGFLALCLVVFAMYGLTRVPTAFLPLEDEGYFLVAVQLPGGASLARTDATLAEVSKRVRTLPGVDNVVTVSGVAVLDNNASLANDGLAYVVLKPWDQRGKSEGLLPMYLALNKALATLPDGRAIVVPPPAIQGIGNVGGFTMEVELRDGSFDFPKLGRLAHAVASNAASQTHLEGVQTTSEFAAPQFDVVVDRTKAATLGVNVNDVFDALSGYLGSTFVNQFTRFGHTFQVYAQADFDFRRLAADIGRLHVKSAAGGLVPLSTLTEVSESVGPPLIDLYNLYPAATVIGRQQRGLSSGQAMSLMQQVAAQTLPAGSGYDWSAVSYQEKVAGSQIYYAFALALALVYLVLAGQYESWIGPLAVILSVPLATFGTVITLLALGVPNTLYTQIGLILLVALAAKNAILIVEFARDLRIKEGKPLIEAAITAGRLRFRPILMTSAAFILGMLPLVTASGAGANASKSIGISVVSGMLISTILSVFVVPTFFVVLRAWEEHRAERKRRRKPAAA
jgi:HAE1 family hydrophobic/amphiphilic exporter-1